MCEMRFMFLIKSELILIKSFLIVNVGHSFGKQLLSRSFLQDRRYEGYKT